MDRGNETWLLILASVFTLEFLKGWLGVVLTVVLIIAGIYNIINLRRKYKLEKARREEEKAKYALEMKKLRRELGEE